MNGFSRAYTAQMYSVSNRNISIHHDDDVDSFFNHLFVKAISHRIVVGQPIHAVSYNKFQKQEKHKYFRLPDPLRWIHKYLYRLNVYYILLKIMNK